MIFTIQGVEKESIAWELQVKPGSRLLKINDREIEDRLDYLFLTSQEYVEVLLEEEGEEVLLEIEKEIHEDLGFIFEHPLMDDAKHCHNACIFCFIDQLPRGLRSSLYFKDDDSRLSFMQGNFVTLTNVTQQQLERIVSYGIYPINVSIHSLNPETRVKMMGNPKAARLPEQLDYLAQNGVKMNGQIVLVPGYNDGEDLRHTLQGLQVYRPHLGSVAIVPLGLTSHRQGLTKLRGFNREEARELVRWIHQLQEELLQKSGSRFVFLADEFYLLAEEEVPTENNYEGYLQLENGVGLVRKYLEDLSREKARLDRATNLSILLATAKLFGPILDNALEELRDMGYDLRVQIIENNFFGESITVGGLMSYEDLRKQVQEESLDYLLLPRSMLNYEGYSLDHVSQQEIQASFSCEVRFIEPTAKALIDFLVEVSHGKTSGCHCGQTQCR